MFSVVALPFQNYQGLPGRLFKSLIALSRYSNRAGQCWPSVRQIARDVMTSPSTAWRDLNELESRGCFTRTRRGRGRFHYTIAEPFRPHWPERQPPADSFRHRQQPDSRVSSGRNTGVPQRETQEAYPLKHQESARPRARFVKSWEKGSPELPDERSKWAMRLRCWQKSHFWQPFWGPKPNQAGCFAPIDLLPGSAASP